MTDWIGRSTYGNAGLDVFYDANGVPIAADDPFAANQPTIRPPRLARRRQRPARAR
jgi:hypothetical protein